MSIMAARTFIMRAGVITPTVDCCPSSPWKYLQCWYTTRQKKASNIIRWNTENKMLFGEKQKPVTKKKASQGESAQGLGKVSPTERGISAKTKGARGKKKEVLTTVAVSESTHSVDFSQSDDSSEWWNEDEMPAGEHKSDTFHAENAHYNTILDSGQGYEGSEGSSDMRSSHRASNSIAIPELLPIPQGKDSQDKTGTAATPKTSDKQKTPKVMSKDISASHFKGADVIQKFPLLPSRFEEVRSSAEEFHSFVDSLNLRVFPTVNTVLNKTRPDLSNFFLQRWREKMIKELGEQGFRKHQEATIWQGTNLHACVQQYLSGVPLADIQVPERNRGHWDSIFSVLPDVTEVQAVETSVAHPWLCYKGTFDCIAKYKNTLYVIDWKTSSKPKPLLGNLYDNPLQVAAYLGAINMTPDFTHRFGVIEQAAIVIAYTNGEAAHVHRIQPALCQNYWREWCQRLHQYWAAVAVEKGVLSE